MTHRPQPSGRDGRHPGGADAAEAGRRHRLQAVTLSLSLDHADPHLTGHDLVGLLETHKHLIKSSTRRYLGLNASLDPEDFQQEAFFALRKCLKKFDPARSTMKFSTYYHWFLQKQFTQCTTEKHHLVELIDAAGRHLDTIPYTCYRKKKRALQHQGITGHIRKRTVPFEDGS